MKKEEIDSQQYAKILEFIVPSLMKNGLKATTMDNIAASLQMSKRTLYEIFGSKEEMFREAHFYIHNKIACALKEIFDNSANVMEAILKCFLFNRDLMSNVSADFIRDMEEYSQQTEMNSVPHKQHHHHHHLFEVLQRGVSEGYFRSDLNLMVQCRMLTIQMEALKRTEELFPKDISLLEVYDNIILSFLRGISSRKGLDELDKHIDSLSSLSKISNQ